MVKATLTLSRALKSYSTCNAPLVLPGLAWPCLDVAKSYVSDDTFPSNELIAVIYPFAWFADLTENPRCEVLAIML